MKRIITLLAFVCLYTTLAFSQKKYELVIEKTDGTEITVNSEDIVRTYFRVNGSNKTDYELAVEKKDGTEVAVHTALIVKTYYRERENDTLLQCPDGNHPHMIDLGLPSGTKWACCNVGASKPEDYGNYYAWGETEEKSNYTWSTYKYYDETSDTYHDIGSDIAGTQYDVAHVKWGGSWVMPSLTQNKELLENCTSEWTTQNGVDGCKFTGPNGGVIFLPAAGEHWNVESLHLGSVGYYWSSTLNESRPSHAYYMGLYSWDVAWGGDYYRIGGRCIRPVR